MKQLGKIRSTIFTFGLGGALLFMVSLIREGTEDILRAVAQAGWLARSYRWVQ
jgi:hypothetical protein